MPTSPQETLQSHDVYPCTLTPRAPGPGAMARRAWLRLLGWAAAARLAVPQAWDQRARAPSGPTVLGHLARQCSALNARAGPRHALPWDRRGGPSSRGRPQPSPGGHAPLLPLGHRRCRGRRAPLALGRVRATPTRAHVVRPGLPRGGTPGLRRQRGLLARGLYRVRVRRDRSTAAGPFLRPAVNRGQTPPTAGGPPPRPMLLT